MDAAAAGSTEPIKKSTPPAAKVAPPVPKLPGKAKPRNRRVVSVKPKIDPEILAVIGKRSNATELIDLDGGKSVKSGRRRGRGRNAKSKRLALDWARKMENSRGLRKSPGKKRFRRRRTKGALSQLTQSYEEQKKEKKTRALSLSQTPSPARRTSGHSFNSFNSIHSVHGLQTPTTVTAESVAPSSTLTPGVPMTQPTPEEEGEGIPPVPERPMPTPPPASAADDEETETTPVPAAAAAAVGDAASSDDDGNNDNDPSYVPPTMAGWLTKKPLRRVGRAQRRWFVLRGTTLSYSVDKHSQLSGTVELSPLSAVKRKDKVGVKVSAKTGLGDDVELQVSLSARADDEATAVKWYLALKKTIKGMRAVDYSGWLLKQPMSRKVMGYAQRRWFALRKNILSYSESEFGKQKGSIELSASSTVIPSAKVGFMKKDADNGFTLYASKVLVAVTVHAAQTKAWIRHLKAAIAACTPAGGLKPPPFMSSSMKSLSDGRSASRRALLERQDSRVLPRWVLNEIDEEGGTAVKPPTADAGASTASADPDTAPPVAVGASAAPIEDDEEEEDPKAELNAFDDAEESSDDDTGQLNMALTQREVLQQKKKMIAEVCAELLETEEKYVHDLSLVVDFVVRPLDALARKQKAMVRGVKLTGSKPVLTPHDVEVLFKDVEVLLQVNRALFETLRGGFEQARRLQRPAPLREVGEIFMSMIPYMRAYGPYCSNYPFAQQKLQHLQATEPLLESFLEEFKARPECEDLNLEDFLIKPVQRMCKYPLFLKQMMRHSDKHHPEYRHLQQASLAIENLTAEIEESMAETIASSQMYRVFLRLCDPYKKQLITPSRRFVSEQAVYLSFPKSSRGGNSRVSLSNTSAAKSAGGALSNANKRLSTTQYGFEVQWEKDSDRQRCAVCEKKFGTLRNRKHHCRMCGKVVCGKCSKGRVAVAIIASGGESNDATNRSRASRRKSVPIPMHAMMTDGVAPEQVEMERVCKRCVDLILRAEAFSSQMPSGYTPEPTQVQKFIASVAAGEGGAKADLTEMRLLIFSDVILLAKPVNPQETVASTVPLSLEYPPLNLSAVVVKAVVSAQNEYFVSIGLPSQHQLTELHDKSSDRKSVKVREVNKRLSLFSLSLNVRCCDQEQMNFIVDCIRETALINAAEKELEAEAQQRASNDPFDEQDDQTDSGDDEGLDAALL